MLSGEEFWWLELQCVQKHDCVGNRMVHSCEAASGGPGHRLPSRWGGLIPPAANVTLARYLFCLGRGGQAAPHICLQLRATEFPGKC